MPISVVTTTTNISSGGSFTLSANANRVIVLALLNRSTADVPNTVTFDGVACTVVAGITGASPAASAIAYCIVPDATSSGAKTVTFANAYVANVYELAGCDRVNPTFHSGTLQNQTNTSTITLNSIIGGWALDCICFAFNQTALNEAAGQTEDGPGVLRYTSSRKLLSAAGTTTMSWTGTFSNGAHTAVMFRPAWEIHNAVAVSPYFMA